MTTRGAGPHTAPSLADKVAFLMQAASYPETTARVDAVETHISWVFLTDAFAYKLKKPVRYDYLDFGTPAARRVDCEEELRLNRRLAPDVYLAVVPLMLGPDGRLGLPGPGQTVDGPVADWLVKMRRLPQERMLDSLIRQRAVSEGEVHALARRLAAFYAGAMPEPMSPEQYRKRLAAKIADHLRDLSSPEFGLPAERVAGIARDQSAFIAQHSALLDARVTQGRIVEGHGDLRPEHVCLLPEPVVIDCLEFKRDFRITDPLDELGHLVLGCEQQGMPEIGPWLLETYSAASGDHWPALLLHFYQSCAATLRAKLAIWHLRDDGRHPPEKWIRATHEYLALAERHIERARA